MNIMFQVPQFPEIRPGRVLKMLTEELKVVDIRGSPKPDVPRMHMEMKRETTWLRARASDSNRFAHRLSVGF
jgi:hypothetical protein